MNRRRIALFSLIAVLGIVGAGAIARGLYAAHGRNHRNHHGAMAHLCQGNVYQKLSQITGYLESELELTADQRKNWDAVTQAVRDSDPKSICPEFADGDTTATAKLAQLEATLSKGLDTVQQVQQPFATFYASLTESQQTDLNALLSHRHHH